MVKREGVLVSSLTLLYALRYALKRIGPSHTVVRDDIFNNIDNLETRDLVQFISEIEKEIKLETFPDKENQKYWDKFLIDLMEEVEKRREVYNAYKKES